MFSKIQSLAIFIEAIMGFVNASKRFRSKVQKHKRSLLLKIFPGCPRNYLIDVVIVEAVVVEAAVVARQRAEKSSTADQL